MKRSTFGLLAAMAIVALPVRSDSAPAATPDASGQRADRLERRARLVRLLGLAEVLDLSDAELSKARDTLNRQDAKRSPIQKQLGEDMDTLRRAASGDATAQSQLDKTAARVFEANEALQKIDRETYDALGKGLSPEKRARLLLFLNQFRNRFGPGMGHGQGRGGMGAGGNRGHGMMGQGRERGPGSGPFED